MLVTAFATPPQGQQLSSVGRHAAVAWRSVSVGVPTRAEDSPGGGLGEAGRHWLGCSCGHVRCCGGHRSCSYWDTVCVQPVGLDRIRHWVLRGAGSLAPWAWLAADPLTPAGSTDE